MKIEYKEEYLDKIIEELKGKELIKDIDVTMTQFNRREKDSWNRETITVKHYSIVTEADEDIKDIIQRIKYVATY